MIQTQTILKVADNSGAKTVKCIKVLGKSSNSHYDYASIGDCILVSVRSLRSGASGNLSNNPKGTSGGKGNKGKIMKVQKGQVYKALVIRTKKNITKRGNGHILSFESNDVVLLNTQDNLIGSRIFGPITRELRARNFRKVMSQSKKLL
jgi:large subunit ribosomal protein L14